MGNDDPARVERIVGQIGDEADRRWLRDRQAAPWQRRARRLADRDARIREFGLAYYPFMTGRGMASAIAVELQRYASAGWRFERNLPAPADQRRRSLWAILHLSDGRGLSAARVRYALAGVVIAPGLKTSRKQATGAARPPGLAVKSGTKRPAAGGSADDHGKS